METRGESQAREDNPSENSFTPSDIDREETSDESNPGQTSETEVLDNDGELMPSPISPIQSLPVRQRAQNAPSPPTFQYRSSFQKYLLHLSGSYLHRLFAELEAAGHTWTLVYSVVYHQNTPNARVEQFNLANDDLEDFFEKLDERNRTRLTARLIRAMEADLDVDDDDLGAESETEEEDKSEWD